MGESESHTEHFPTLHIVTPEFPPASGGVAGHTSLLANGLRARGFPVVTWCSKGKYCSEEVDKDDCFLKNLVDLGEDRFLTSLMLMRSQSQTSYVSNVRAYTACPDSFLALLHQRRRWFNSSLYPLPVHQMRLYIRITLFLILESFRIFIKKGLLAHKSHPQALTLISLERLISSDDKVGADFFTRVSVSPKG